MNIKILLVMIALHIIDDFCFQGILSSLKQKKWWQEQKEYKDMYKTDYVCCLIVHSFKWTFFIMLPWMISLSSIGVLFLSVFVVNIIIHAVIDDLKANKFRINLWQDQGAHIFQIIITFLIFSLT